jgi:signal transduction histidine kinase/CheY-like chemotaxis protein
MTASDKPVSQPVSAPRDRWFRKPAVRDFALAVLAFGAVLAAFVGLEFVEWIFDTTRRYEALEPDEWIAAVLALALAAAWYSYRRWRESARVSVQLADTVETLRATTEELVRAKNATEQANEAKSNFLATMSHEIRTPLNVVIPISELLLETRLDETQKVYAQTVRDSGNALLTILNDILDIAKIETGQIELERRTIDLTSLIEGVADLYRVSAASKSLELSVFVDPHVMRPVIGDRNRLRQILVNMVGNATKFTEVGGVSIEVTAEEQETEGDLLIRFEITDTGIGIAEQNQASVFETFSQADTSATRRYGGTGLGLAICQKFVAAMGGEIGVRSTPGGGSKFWFTAHFEFAAEAAGATVPPNTDLGAVRALVVDDLELNRMVLEKQIVAFGAQASTADGGTAALDALRKAADRGAPYHVVFLDHMMPDMDGLAVAAELRDDPALSATPLVLTSSGLLPESDVRAEFPNFWAYLNKPLGTAAVKECLTEIGQAASGRRAGTDLTEEGTADPGPLQILVAEDQAVNQQIAVALLERLGHSVDIVGDGLGAVSAAESGACDVILMDINMPRMDGLEAIKVIKGLEGPAADIPIIALTADAMPSDREKYLGLGFDDYISKPIVSDDLQRAIARSFGRREPRMGGGPVAVGKR